MRGERERSRIVIPPGRKLRTVEQRELTIVGGSLIVELEVEPPPEPPEPEPAPSTLILEDGFEGSGIDTSKWSVSETMGGAHEVTAAKSREGGSCLKTIVQRTNDPTKQYRSEITPTGKYNEQRTKTGQPCWWGWSWFIPSSNRPDPQWEIFAQWHGSPDEGEANDGNPPLCFQCVNGELLICWNYNPSQPTEKQYQKAKSRNFGPLLFDQWVDYVVMVVWNWDAEENGELQIWQNGEELMHLHEPIGHRNQRTEYVKLGIYKSKQPVTPGCETRIVYHDAFRWAGADGSYDAVAPRVDRYDFDEGG